MIYPLHDLNSLATEPARRGAKWTARALLHPRNPLSRTPAGRALGAAWDVWGNVGRRPGKPDFALQHVAGSRVMEHVVHETPWCALRRFTLVRRLDAPRVLVVAPMSGNHATLLRDTVAGLLESHDVWITDWRCASQVPTSAGDFGFDDYVFAVRDTIRRLHGAGRRQRGAASAGLHVLAVCQPGVPVLAAVALMAEDDEPAQPVSLTLMGSPVDTRKSPGTPNTFAKSKPLSWFRRNLISRVPLRFPGRGRRVYPGFMQISAFMAMKPQLHLDKHVAYVQAVVAGDTDKAAAHNAFYDEFLASVDLPERFYLETVDRVFQRHLLPRGELEVGGRRVRPERITATALMTVEGAKDDITGPGQCSAAQELCTGLRADQRARHVQPGAGHMGIFSGSRWRDTVRPAVTAFMAAAERSRQAAADRPRHAAS